MKSKSAVLILAATALLAVSASRSAAQPLMNMEQTLSDEAQRMTIAFDGLAFLTGCLGADSFLPPGKVADFSGFQYLRDNDPTSLGHNTDFVTIIARNVLNILSADQIAQLVQRAESQIALINQYGYERFPLMDAFRRRLNNTMPAGCTELDWAAVTEHSADLYYIDGLISLDRAQLFGDILRNLTAAQKTALNNLTTLGGVGNWNATLADPLESLHLAPDISVGVMTYASEMYSWYAGSVEADTYFCPERQGTYFGSFYLKDAPAMGNPDYTIDSNLTADSGNAFLAVLTPAQQAMVTNLVLVQKPYLYDLVDVRSNVSVALRQLLTASVIDTNAVLALCRHYGELDGMIVYSFATHFAHVNASLTTDQQAQLAALRLKMLGPDLYYPSGAYLYSAPIALPTIPNTDSFFAFAVTNRLALEDTGQTSSYTGVFGEDADYTLHPPSFTTSGGMVEDLVTGRTWQQTDGGEMTWEDATNYAASLTLGGYTDWRLPTAHELFGIINHGAVNPALDPAVFTGSTAEYWWSQDRQVGNASNVWVVNAGGGIGPHPMSETLSAGGTKRFHVRCVRGAPAPSEVGLRHHLSNNADGTITDLDTGLTWQAIAAGAAMNWEAALHYADGLALAGYTDWRLPNIKELQSISDETLANPSLDTNFFTGASAARHWSSTTVVNQPNRAWHLDAQLGIVSYDDKTTSLMVRCVRGGGTNAVVAAGAAPVPLATGFGFTEGPATDAAGNVYFSDVTANTIHCWSLAGELSVFRTDSGGSNGLSIDRSGNLVACEGGNGRISSTDSAGNVTVLAAAYNGLRFNEPNDLWVDPAGGIYFTDPVYFGHAVVQGGEYVYYLAPGSASAVRVATDLVRPNGIVGSPNGQTLYIADWGASKVYRYTIAAGGALTGKTVFASVRCDGLDLDAAGRLYLCENAVRVFSAAGVELEQISIPERPTNLEFGGAQRQFLFITTDGGSLYAVRMSSQGVTASTASNQPPVISAVSLMPDVPRANDTVCVTARVVDDASVASVLLTYACGALQGQTNLVFQETMRSAECKPWSGDACANAWTVAWSGSNPFEQRGGANYGGGNPNGLEFKLGTANLTDSTITTAQGIDARGTSGYLEFWLWADGLSGEMGWTMQLGNASGYSTRLSELTGANHGWQLYHYDLQPQDLVSNLSLRFQFRGGGGDPRIDLDSLAMRVVAAGTTCVSVAMRDDGAHQDGVAGDGVYGAFIPPQTAGTSVYYYLTATDASDAASVSPTTAPSATLSYTVAARPPTAATLGWFRAQRTAAGEVDVSWQTLVEVETLGFRVERSRPGAAWEGVGLHLVPAQGADQKPHVYQVTDTTAPPSDGLVYRLIALDLRGAERIVAEAYVSRDLDLRVRFDPEGLKIELQGVSNGTLALETTTALGEAWVLLDPVSLDSEGRGTVSFPLAGGESKRFFRAIQP